MIRTEEQGSVKHPSVVQVHSDGSELERGSKYTDFYI